MKQLFYFSLPLLGLISCAESNTEKTPVETDKVSEPRSLVIGDPLECGIENFLMFPIGSSYRPEVTNPTLDEQALRSTLNFSKNQGLMYDSNALTEYVNGSEDDFDITNILFYDLETGNSYPLVGKNDTLHILSFAIHNEFKNPLIFYRVVKRDFNCDSAYNSKDAVMLYVSPLKGDTLIQVTPNQEQFVDYFYYRENQKVLIKTRIDTDRDSVYSHFDETSFVQMNLNAPAFGEPLFSKELKDDLKGKLNLSVK